MKFLMNLNYFHSHFSLEKVNLWPHTCCGAPRTEKELLVLAPLVRLLLQFISTSYDPMWNTKCSSHLFILNVLKTIILKILFFKCLFLVSRSWFKIFLSLGHSVGFEILYTNICTSRFNCVKTNFQAYNNGLYLL